MNVRNLLTGYWKYVSAPPDNGITKAQAIQIATKIYKERGIPISRVGVAMRSRDTYTMTANADTQGGGWFISIDRRKGEAKPPFLIIR